MLLSLFEAPEKKRKILPQAFWNKTEVAPIPRELANLSDIEKRMLCRVVPFLKIIKVNNRFSQKWCKGQVVLFAQDVVELASTKASWNQLVAETLENVQQHRQFEANIDKLKLVLQCLLTNNVLYNDVRLCLSSAITSDLLEIVHVAEVPVVTTSRTETENIDLNRRFIDINNN